MKVLENLINNNTNHPNMDALFLFDNYQQSMIDNYMCTVLFIFRNFSSFLIEFAHSKSFSSNSAETLLTILDVLEQISIIEEMLDNKFSNFDFLGNRIVQQTSKSTLVGNSLNTIASILNNANKNNNKIIENLCEILTTHQNDTNTCIVINEVRKFLLSYGEPNDFEFLKYHYENIIPTKIREKNKSTITDTDLFVIKSLI